MSAIRRIRKAVREGQVEFTDHALEEMDNDYLTLADVRTVLLPGKIRDRLEDDPRGARYVVQSALEGETVDVVCRFLASGLLRIITVYVVREVGE